MWYGQWSAELALYSVVYGCLTSWGGPPCSEDVYNTASAWCQYLTMCHPPQAVAHYTALHYHRPPHIPIYSGSKWNMPLRHAHSYHRTVYIQMDVHNSDDCNVYGIDCMTHIHWHICIQYAITVFYHIHCAVQITSSKLEKSQWELFVPSEYYEPHTLISWQLLNK